MDSIALDAMLPEVVLLRGTSVEEVLMMENGLISKGEHESSGNYAVRVTQTRGSGPYMVVVRCRPTERK